MRRTTKSNRSVRRSFRRHRVAVGGAVAVFVHLAAEQAWAQKVVILEPEDSFWPWLVFIGVGALALAAAFINPKRSHLN